MDDVHDAFQDKESVDIGTIREVNKELEQTRSEASSKVNRFADETARSRAQMKPVDSLNTSMKSIDNIDKDQVARMDPRTKEEFYRLVALMKEKLDDL